MADAPKVPLNAGAPYGVQHRLRSKTVDVSVATAGEFQARMRDKTPRTWGAATLSEASAPDPDNENESSVLATYTFDGVDDVDVAGTVHYRLKLTLPSGAIYGVIRSLTVERSFP
jgi:hypothetical protein